MSGNLIFNKTPDDYYELVFDYDTLISPGETIKGCTVYVNNEEISGVYSDRFALYEAGSGSYNSVFTYDPMGYDNNTVLVAVGSGMLGSGYAVEVKAITNRRNEYNKTIDVFIDDLAFPDVYDNFQYRFLVDSYNIYLPPVITVVDDVFYSSFNYNTEYTVTIDQYITSVNDLQMTQPRSFWFTSKYCPMFASAPRLIFLLGPEGEKFTGDTINRYIHRNSIEVIDMMNLSRGCNSLNKIPYNYYGCTPENVPFNLRRYVECKTAYDLLNLLDRLRLIG